TIHLLYRPAYAFRDTCKYAGPSEIGDSAIRHSLEGSFGAHIWRAVVLRVEKRHLRFQSIGVEALPGLFDPRVKTLRVAEIIEPRSFIETDCIHSKSISIPFSNGVPVPCRTEIVQGLTPREFPAVSPQ